MAKKIRIIIFPVLHKTFVYGKARFTPHLTVLSLAYTENFWQSVLKRSSPGKELSNHYNYEDVHDCIPHMQTPLRPDRVRPQ